MKLSLLYTFVFITHLLSAQTHLFTVLATKGENKVYKEKQWMTLKTGDQLFKNDKLQIGSTGYIGLIHKTGKTVEIKTAGIYQTASLTSSFHQKNTSSYSKKYFNYILGFSTRKDTTSNIYYNVTASVERTSPKEGPYFFSPKTINAIKGIPFTVTWSHNDLVESYQLLSLDERSLYRIDTKGDSSANIDFTNISPNTIVLGGVFDKSSTSLQDNFFQKISVKENKTILQEYKRILKEQDMNTATGHLVMAAFFEKNKLTQYAISHLYLALKQEKEVTTYQNIYLNYLLQHNILITDHESDPELLDIKK